ncbi:MAG: hypothetical protein ABMA02_12935 [Saprospiraceae bacterium]
MIATHELIELWGRAEERTQGPGMENGPWPNPIGTACGLGRIRPNTYFCNGPAGTGCFPACRSSATHPRR